MMSKLPWILVGVGIVVSVAALIVGYVVFPKIINGKITTNVRLVQGSDTYKKWENIPIPIYYKVHIFNVTNPQDVIKGGKPILQELGPYVYQQKRRKTDIVVNEEDDTITYRQPVDFFFRPDMSGGTEQDVVSVVNLPYVGVAAKALKMSNMQRYIVSELFTENYASVKPFMTLPVETLLFKGYHVNFMAELAELSGETLLPNNTFGIYYGKNGSDAGLLDVHSGVKDNTKFGSFATWNGKKELDYWDDKYCNMINGSDGALFPPFVTKDRVLQVFSPELCRSLHLTFESETQLHGIPGYRFTLPPELLSATNPDNLCFCTDRGKNMEKCPKSGAYQLQSCRKGAPLVVSLPHFLDGDSYYQETIGGLQPDKEKHETVIILEPNTGVLLRASKRIQINIELAPNKFFPAMKTLPTLLLPVVWVDESAVLPEESAERLHGKLLKPVKVSKIATWAAFGVGCLLVVVGVILHFVRNGK